VTAGNAPGLNDGAAALVVMAREKAAALGLKPLARIVGYTHAAVEPEWLFIAPARAVPKLLARTGWKLEDVDLIEINEAFAAQVLADGKDMLANGLAWDWNKVNVNGGAVALRHPIGCSGARVIVTLIHALRPRRQRGIATLCLGGGEPWPWPSGKRRSFAGVNRNSARSAGIPAFLNNCQNRRILNFADIKQSGWWAAARWARASSSRSRARATRSSRASPSRR
jgi:hypothetical protein